MSAQLKALEDAVMATQAKIDQLILLLPAGPLPSDESASLQIAADALKAADDKLDAAIAKLTPT